MNDLRTKEVYNLDNSYQRNDVAGLVYVVASRCHEGRLATTLMCADTPYNWHPQADGRSAEMKEFREAEKAMWQALTRYDSARLAAIAKGKTK